jgi:magnesium chelatase subunit D
VLLPPSKSITLAQRRLAQLPTGGGTPLAHGLLTAARVALNAEKTGSAGGGVGRARVVCLTDGGANIGLDRSLAGPTQIGPLPQLVTRKA